MEKDNHHYPEVRMENLGTFCLQSTEKGLYAKASSSTHPPGNKNVGNIKKYWDCAKHSIIGIKFTHIQQHLDPPRTREACQSSHHRAEKGALHS